MEWSSYDYEMAMSREHERQERMIKQGVDEKFFNHPMENKEGKDDQDKGTTKHERRV